MEKKNIYKNGTTSKAEEDTNLKASKWKSIMKSWSTEPQPTHCLAFRNISELRYLQVLLVSIRMSAETYKDSLFLINFWLTLIPCNAFQDKFDIKHP